MQNQTHFQLMSLLYDYHIKKYTHTHRSSILWVLQCLTLICLFSSRSLCTSTCSRLHSSMIFFTSPSSSEALADFDSAVCSVLTEEEEDTVLLLSLSCCGDSEGVRVTGGKGMRRRAGQGQR